MTKKLTGRALARFEAERDIWQEVVGGVREIKSGRRKRSKVALRSPIVRTRLKSGLSQHQLTRAGTRPPKNRAAGDARVVRPLPGRRSQRGESLVAVD